MRVTIADFIRHYGRFADRALVEPLTITENGHDRLMVLSVEAYEKLRRRERCVISSGELTEEEVALIAAAEVPPEHAHLDDELEHWQL